MAVPSAIQKQREKLKLVEPDGTETLAGQVSGDTQLLPGVDQQIVSQEVTGDDDVDLANYTEQLTGLNDRLSNASTPEEVAQVRQDIATLKDKYSSLLGRLRAESTRANTAEARLHLQDDTVRTLEGRATIAEKERDELRAQQRESERKVKLAGLDDGDELSEEELSELDPKDVRMIKGLTKKQLVPAITTLLAEVEDLKAQVLELQTVGQRVSEIDKSHQVLAHQAAASAERSFYIKALSPHFSNWEKWVETPEWKTFLALPENDDPNVKKGHVLAHYRKSKFVPGIVALFKEFESRNGKEGNNSLGALATPAKTSADRTPTAKPRMKSSEYVKMLNAYSRSKSISKEQWDKFKASFHTAQKEGRVDDDASMFNR